MMWIALAAFTSALRVRLHQPDRDIDSGVEKIIELLGLQ